MDDEDEPGAHEEAPDEEGSPRTAAGFAAGLLVGALLGVTVGLLFAPERGDRTRRAVRKRLQRLREDAGEELERAGAVTRRELLRRRRRLQARLERALDRL
jgi:gas vesicle protein